MSSSFNDNLTEQLPLSGAKILVTGVANQHSIAAGCAQAYVRAGAEVGLTYLNDKARFHVKTVADAVDAAFLCPYDARVPVTADGVFEEIGRTWGHVDHVLHSIAYCPLTDLLEPLHECSQEGFLEAMEITCYSLVDLARRSAAIMPKNGSITTVSYLGGQRVLPDYNVMAPVKAALEATVRTLAYELGPRGIRVHALSPGPMDTRAASGLEDFDRTMERARQVAPLRRLASPEDVGSFAAFLAGPGASATTGNVHFVDGGLHVMGWDDGDPC
ncbi:enoyl-ACP reductase FabI [Parvularcula sp. ZS-1/3]|uniref:Enoyl-[acyl-carrier-protein] reductase [NADH] n=1 Tax=Parvularcula mediterranea TaxID=2732508 RepID=A0A7Y3RNU9_9PROT|nr:enoyl-ACP reductase FabI [Parvularcula mediterranea]NNU17549.1 enoyl-ACP reductase FabI [Parvularcula mediterranea]